MAHGGERQRNEIRAILVDCVITHGMNLREDGQWMQPHSCLTFFSCRTMGTSWEGQTSCLPKIKRLVVFSIDRAIKLGKLHMWAWFINGVEDWQSAFHQNYWSFPICSFPCQVPRANSSTHDHDPTWKRLGLAWLGTWIAYKRSPHFTLILQPSMSTRVTQVAR